MTRSVRFRAMAPLVMTLILFATFVGLVVGVAADPSFTPDDAVRPVAAGVWLRPSTEPS